MKGFLSEERPIRTLREVLQRLRESYCGTIGYEARPPVLMLHWGTLTRCKVSANSAV